MGTHPIFESDFDCLTAIECNVILFMRRDTCKSVRKRTRCSFKSRRAKKRKKDQLASWSSSVMKICPVRADLDKLQEYSQRPIQPLQRPLQSSRPPWPRKHHSCLSIS